MSYTNVTIPTESEIEEARQKALDRAASDYWRGLAFDLLRRLNNIPQAVIDHGHVDIDGTTLTAVSREDGA